jgi:hypothetical protein
MSLEIRAAKMRLRHIEERAREIERSHQPAWWKQNQLAKLHAQMHRDYLFLKEARRAAITPADASQYHFFKSSI